MKKLLLAILLVAAATITYSFTTASKTNLVTVKAATPISFDVSYSGVDIFFNTCSGEVVTLNYEGTFSARGVINNNRANVSLHTVEKYEGTGATSGETY